MIENPYLEKFEKSHGGKAHRPNFDSPFEMYKKYLDFKYNSPFSRDVLVREYAYAIPDQRALEIIARHGPIIELGAGTGYWAWLLRQMNVEVFAYDLHPPPHEENHWYSNAKTFTEVLKGDVDVLDRHPDCTLFLCWPPGGMEQDALVRYRGQRVVYIGEGIGGCCACDEFFETLDKEWEEVEEATVPQWDGIHDYLTVYERKC